MPAFIAFIAAIAVLAAVFMLIVPQDRTEMTAGNSYGNIMNGGRVLSAGGYLFYASDTEGLLKIPVSESAAVTTTEKIADSGAYNLSEVGSKIYFELPSGFKCFDFVSTQDIAVGSAPQLIGSWVYYVNSNGNIAKMRLGSSRETDTGLACSGSFCVENAKIYYRGTDGCIYSASQDGSGVKLLISDSVDRFFLKNEYLYYSSGSTLSAFMIFDQITTVIADIESGSAFNMFGYNMLYVNGGIKSVDLSQSNVNREEKEISTMTAAEIYATDDAAYFVTDAGELYSIITVPSEPKPVNLGI